jgi:glycosyltransferase involved in cell wall biosynthesis
VPLVSVCMKSYNRERLIGEAIESVLGQDFEDLELIIVEDASTDATRQIIERYAKQDPRIRVIFHERNLGISRSSNDGIAAAKGKFIAVIDSDDVWVADKLTKQLAVLERDEDLIVWSEGEVVDHAGRPIGKSFSELHGNTLAVNNGGKLLFRKPSGYIWQELLWSNYIFHSTVIYKKGNLGDVRYDEGLPLRNDFKFFLELARRYQFHYIAEPLAKYRIHDYNISRGSGSEGLERRRMGAKEDFSIVEDAMRQYGDEIPRETRAAIYERIGSFYYSTGEQKKGARFFLRAIACNPLEERTFRYLRLGFKRMLRAMSPRV